jgi:tetratricopeptide (TPR) repeat protein
LLKFARIRHACGAHPRIVLALLLAACAISLWIGVLWWRAAQFWAAERGLREGDLVATRTRLTRCLTYWPRDAAVLCLAARLERVEGHYDTAAALLGNCVQHNGPTPLSALEAALLQAQRGDLTDERALVSLIEAKNPESAWILEALARAHLGALRFRPALRFLDRWLNIQPDCVRALELKGRIFEHTGRVPDAAKVYEQALELDPADWPIRVRLAGILLHHTDLEKASVHLKILERDHADQAEVCAALGQRDALRGDLDGARSWLQRALASEPEHFGALLQLGKLELQMDRPQDAVKHLSRAAQLRPSASDVHLGLSSCYSLMANKTQAEFHRRKFDLIQKHVNRINEILIEKIPARPTDPVLLAEAGTRFLAIGEDRFGVDCLRRALQFDPHYQPAQAALADYYERSKQAAKAARDPVGERGKANQPTGPWPFP